MEILMFCAFLALMIFLIYPDYSIVFNKDVWGISCVFFCCLMTSGQVWNEINNPPFMSRNYFHHTNRQCVLETFVIVICYSIFIAAIIMMIEAASSTSSNENRRSQAMTGLTLAMLFFSITVVLLQNKVNV